MKTNFLLTVGLLLLIGSVSFAQDRIIHGRVFTFDSIPLVKASIEVKSTKQVVFSDTLGNFSVGCAMEDQLKVSARGFSTVK